MKNVMIPLPEGLAGFHHPFRLVMISYCHDSLLRRTTWKWSSYTEICIRLSGDEACAHDEIDGVEHVSPFPHVVLKIPGCTHIYEVSRPRNTFSLFYPPETIDRFREYGMIGHELTWPITLTREIESDIVAILQLIENMDAPMIRERIDAAGFALAQEVCWQRKNLPPMPLDQTESTIRHIAASLLTEPGFDIDLEALASKYGMSRRTFFRHWHRHYQKTPHQFVAEKRMDEAARMLRETDLPACAIAEHLGFRTPSHFCHAFHLFHGTTPNVYRQQNILPQVRM